MYPYVNIPEDIPDYVYFDEYEQSFALGEKVITRGSSKPHEVRGYRPSDNCYGLDMGNEILWFPERMLIRG